MFHGLTAPPTLSTNDALAVYEEEESEHCQALVQRIEAHVAALEKHLDTAGQLK